MRQTRWALGALALLAITQQVVVAVELPPVPSNVSVIKDPWKPGLKLPAYVIQTDTGLRECPSPWVDTSCRDYVPGRDRRMRAFVVKRNGTWMICPRRDSAARCSVRGQMPQMEVQD